MPKNIGDTELGNKEEPDDPKVKLAHIMDLDSRQEGRQYKIAQFNEVTKKLNIEVATQKKAEKRNLRSVSMSHRWILMISPCLPGWHLKSITHLF